MLRRLCLLVVALLAAGLVAAVPAYAAAPTITGVTPLTGGIDTAFTVTGTGFATGAVVTVGGVTARSVVVASATRITAKVPVTGSGPVVVRTAEGTATGPTFTVTAGASVSPTVVRPSGSATLYGTGFSAGEAVDLYLDSTAVGLVVAASNGTVARAVATALTTTPGTHWLSAVGRRSGVAAQVALVVRTDWNAPGFDTSHTGVNRYETQIGASTVDDLSERWTTYYGRQVYGAPVVASGLVVVHTLIDDVIALDAATGVQRWSVDLSTGTTGYSAPVVAGGIVYVGASDGRVYALTLSTGAVRWSYDTGGPVSDNLTVVGGTVFVPSRGGAFYALDALTGAVRWGTSFGSGVFAYAPTVVGPWLYVGTSDNTMRRMDAAGGGTGWVVDLNTAPFAAPVVADGKVFVPLLGGNVLALRAATGAIEWGAQVGNGSVTGTPALVGGRLIVSNTASVVTAYDASTGAVLWTQSGATAAGYSAVSVANGVAFVSSDKRTFAYDVRTGTILRRITAGPNSAGVVISDGALFGYDYTETQVFRWDLGPRPAAKAPAVATLQPGA